MSERSDDFALLPDADLLQSQAPGLARPARTRRARNFTGRSRPQRGGRRPRQEAGHRLQIRVPDRQTHHDPRPQETRYRSRKSVPRSSKPR
jgi:hypothetical protein